jgi:hypothetical protein
MTQPTEQPIRTPQEPIRTPQERAVEFLRELLEHASWYNSAIELDHDQDGEVLWQSARSIVDGADAEVLR